MTSPGGWFGGFLDENTGGKPTTPTGSSRPPTSGAGRIGLPPLPKPAPGSAVNPVEEASKTGQILYDALDMPKEWADDAFTMGTADDGSVVRMTVARGLEWLRDLSRTNKEEYNAWVVKLYDAGYLDEKDLRFGAYTSTVGQKFVEAAYDTAMSNLDDGGGVVISLGDNLQHIADAAKEAGLNGPGGGTARVRVDQQLDDATLKDSIRTTSRNLLGRALTDDEEAKLVGRFRSAESAWNNNNWNAENNGGTETSAPDAGALTETGIKEGSLATERAAQQFAGYAGVLRDMVGLSGAGSVGNTLG